MTDRLSGIEVFVAVVEAGSFALAAEKLFVSRSAVGKSVARLEQRLGILLFNRTTRSQSLTDEGALYYEHSVRALNELRSAEVLLETGKCQVSGRLRVSMPVLFGHLCIAPILIELAEQHPKLTLELSFNDRAVDLVEEGYDLVIRNGALPDSGDLVARHLGEHQMTLCASPTYLKKHGEPRTMDDLKQHEAVGYMRFGRMLSWKFLVDGNVEEFIPKARVMMDDLQAVLDATIVNSGIGWLPHWLVRDYFSRGELKALMVDYTGVAFPINAVWPRTPHLLLKTRVAVDALLDKLPARLAKLESISR